ncbi:hypothetical protein Ciccas_003479 [Cichlidogyrus casuarinus]|uniref:Uncharacterized protein n=1 Tax=Cichlidogyrus casuarinus TaxID=1844966 RepID=A0ABD2QE89_9PLAT
MDNTTQLEELDVTGRYPRSYDLISKFAPQTLLIDRYGTAFFLPINFIGSIFVILIHIHILINGGRSITRRSTNNLRESIKDYTGTYSSENISLSHWTITHSIFLANLAIGMLFHGVIIALIDLDWAWNMAILGRVRFFCSTVHVLDSTLQLWIQLVCIFLALNAFIRLKNPRKAGVLLKRLNLWFFAGQTNMANEWSPYNLVVDDKFHRLRAIKVCVLSFIVALVLGSIELMYWGVEYFADPQFSKTGSVTMAYCEVSTAPNGLSRLFFSPINKIEDSLMSEYGQSVKVEQAFRAQSYMRYAWFRVLFLELPCSLINLVLALKILKVIMLDRPNDLQKINAFYGPSEDYLRMSAVSAANRFWADNAKLAVGINLMLGILSIPKICIILLLPLALPKTTLITDAHVSLLIQLCVRFP